MFRTKVVEKIKTHFSFSKLLSENRASYEIMWKNMVQPGKPQMIILRMRFASWITKDTNTHSDYVILIAFPRQQWFRECGMLYAHCLSCYALTSQVSWYVVLQRLNTIPNL